MRQGARRDGFHREDCWWLSSSSCAPCLATHTRPQCKRRAAAAPPPSAAPCGRECHGPRAFAPIVRVSPFANQVHIEKMPISIVFRVLSPPLLTPLSQHVPATPPLKLRFIYFKFWGAVKKKLKKIQFWNGGCNCRATFTCLDPPFCAFAQHFVPSHRHPRPDMSPARSADRPLRAGCV